MANSHTLETDFQPQDVRPISDVEVRPSTAVDAELCRAVSACYPRYLFIRWALLLFHSELRITMTCFRTCSELSFS